MVESILPGIPLPKGTPANTEVPKRADDTPGMFGLEAQTTLDKTSRSPSRLAATPQTTHHFTLWELQLIHQLLESPVVCVICHLELYCHCSGEEKKNQQTGKAALTQVNTSGPDDTLDHSLPSDTSDPDLAPLDEKSRGTISIPPPPNLSTYPSTGACVRVASLKSCPREHLNVEIGIHLSQGRRRQKLCTVPGLRPRVVEPGWRRRVAISCSALLLLSSDGINTCQRMTVCLPWNVNVLTSDNGNPLKRKVLGFHAVPLACFNCALSLTTNYDMGRYRSVLRERRGGPCRGNM